MEKHWNLYSKMTYLEENASLFNDGEKSFVTEVKICFLKRFFCSPPFYKSGHESPPNFIKAYTKIIQI